VTRWARFPWATVGMLALVDAMAGVAWALLPLPGWLLVVFLAVTVVAFARPAIEGLLGFLRPEWEAAEQERVEDVFAASFAGFDDADRREIAQAAFQRTGWR
jgi:hypothetical protein